MALSPAEGNALKALLLRPPLSTAQTPWPRASMKGLFPAIKEEADGEEEEEGKAEAGKGERE